MGSVWIQNKIGMKVNEDQMKDIPYPLMELIIHVTEKTVQTGSYIGGWFVPFIVHAFKRKPSLTAKMARYGRNGMLIGLPLGPIMTYAQLKAKKADEASIYDRTYRLRRNTGQLIVDRASIIGGLIGYGLLRGWLGVVTGVNIGILTSAIYNNGIKPRMVSKDK